MATVGEYETGDAHLFALDLKGAICRVEFQLKTFKQHPLCSQEVSVSWEVQANVSLAHG